MITVRRWAGPFTVLLIAVLLAGCSTAQPSSSQGPVTATLPSADPESVDAQTPQLPVTVDSADGRRVTVTDISRIVAFDLYGTYATTVFGLGLGAHLAGRDIAAKFPAAQSIPVINPGGTAVDVEAVLALRPTVVLTDTSMPAAAAAQRRLIDAGVPVVFFDHTRSVGNAGALIHAVADALGVPDAGTRLTQRVDSDLAQAKALVPHDRPAPTVAFVYARGTGLMLLGGPGSGADSLLETVGARDGGTAAGLTAPFTMVTAESLIMAAPDALLMMTGGLKSLGGVDGLEKTPGIAQTPAGRAHRVIDMDDGVLLSFGPRTGQVALTVAKALYG
ncbi:putative ABC transporter, substrate-binding protein [Nocardia nova SH22a]|uniref:Putative ABC transporter, substrate-binding protein n=1 Tax=Nocardia nova SH22a TaxID=1415166 RepID=W5TLP5_9NOCA|nr:ABC transporter substrate-binding protein [Nocardia nova]AHH18161.1 putative ABC transporter, substrate-binding protein [Nocardia nova SH22a]